MHKRSLKISLIVVLTYWLTSSLALLNIIKGFVILPFWIDSILMPGYIVGFILGYGGGHSWSIIGQLITLLILYFITRTIYKLYRH